jgi:hypothetical protein
MVLCVKAAGPPPTQVPEAPRLWGLCRWDDRARTGDLVVVCELRRAELLGLSTGNRGCLVVKSGRRLQCGTYAGSGLVRWRTPLALGSLRPGPDRPVGHGEDDAGLDQPTPCSQSQFGRDRHLLRHEAAQVEAASALSVVVRWEPVRTAVSGTLVARAVRMTWHIAVLLAPS